MSLSNREREKKVRETNCSLGFIVKVETRPEYDHQVQHLNNETKFVSSVKRFQIDFYRVLSFLSLLEHEHSSHNNMS